MNILSDNQKRNIRESLVYALVTSIPRNRTHQRLVVEEFYAGLNRKLILTNEETEEERNVALQTLQDG